MLLESRSNKLIEPAEVGLECRIVSVCGIVIAPGSLGPTGIHVSGGAYSEGAYSEKEGLLRRSPLGTSALAARVRYHKPLSIALQ